MNHFVRNNIEIPSYARLQIVTETQNESEDQDFDKIDDFIEESYDSRSFYISTLKDYYLENIKELINDIEL